MDPKIAAKLKANKAAKPKPKRTPAEQKAIDMRMAKLRAMRK